MLRCLPLLASSLLASMPLAHAATLTWTGNASALWSDAGNWDTATAPANGDSLVFPPGAANAVNRTEGPIATL